MNLLPRCGFFSADIEELQEKVAEETLTKSQIKKGT